MDIEFYRHYANSLEAARRPAWRYNEMKPCGVNYNSTILAHLYDRCHQSFRDFRQEAERIVALLALGPESTAIDMGCGTGAFALHAAPRCGKVYAVDVSKAMLQRARKKARKAGIDNIEFHHGGLLTYEHRAEPVDAINSVAVLHHLPDFWKLVALRRMAAMLKPKGRLHLFDVVFSFNVARYESSCKRFVKAAGDWMGPSGQAEAETHLSAEYSTCDWIMEGLLEEAGFDVETADRKDDFLTTYVCTKKDG